MESLDVTELVAGLQAGDEAARARFCAEYLRLVRAAVARKLADLTQQTPSSAEVDDLCNEIFERLLSDGGRAFSRLRNPKSLNAWLTTIAQNRVIDHIRQISSRSRIENNIAREEQAEYAPSPRENVVQQEQDALLRTALDQVAPQDRLVLELYFIHNLKYAEISSVMNININSVANYLRRGKARLRELLERDRDEFIHS